MVYEIESDGTVVIRDAQINKTYRGEDEILYDLFLNAPIDAATYGRVDNLELKSGVIDYGVIKPRTKRRD